MTLKPKPKHSSPVVRSVLFTCAFFLASSACPAQDSDQARQDLTAVNTAIEEIQAWLAEASARQSQEIETLKQADLQISAMIKSVATTESARSETEREMRALSARSEQLEEDKSAQNAILAQAIRTAYMAGNQSAMKLLLKQQGISKSARMLHYHRLFTESQLASIASYQEVLSQLATVNVDLRSHAARLQHQQVALNRKLLSLSESKQQREVALAELSATISSRSSELEQLEIDQAELRQLIEQINRAIADIPASARNSPFIEQRGKLQMPVQGNIISAYGSRYGDGNLQRQGITIAVSEGTPVQAIHPGRVVFSDWLRGTGLLVIVDHGAGYMSLYGANQALSKQAGDWVDAGDILATSGKPREASPSQEKNQRKTGVYFEIRHHAEAQNPGDWFAN